MPAREKRFHAATHRAGLPYSLQDEGGHPDSARRLKHLHDDDLVLYHYGEIRTAPAETHLRICRGCRDRLRSMPFDPASFTPPPAELRPRVKPEPDRPRAARPRGLFLRLLARLLRGVP